MIKDGSAAAATSVLECASGCVAVDIGCTRFRLSVIATVMLQLWPGRMNHTPNRGLLPKWMALNVCSGIGIAQSCAIHVWP